jgi:DNA-binding NarL/FixJ family response regulator
MKLMIVEEKAAMRRLIRSLVEEMPFSVSECHDGAQAVAACVAEKPDWVLLDINLGATDAIETARQISAACPRAKIVVVTDDDDARLRAVAKQAGAFAYVLKESLFEVRRLLRPHNV